LRLPFSRRVISTKQSSVVPATAIPKAAIAFIPGFPRAPLTSNCAPQKPLALRHYWSPNVAAPFIDHSSEVWNFLPDGSLYLLFSCSMRKVKPMRKTLMALAAIATLAISALAVPAPAYAQRGFGAAVAGGLIGGAIVGGALASPYYYGPGYGYYGPGYGYYGGPAYVGGPGPGYAGDCYWQQQRFWDGYAWRFRRVRVCG
jgi:hypothetical protein